MLTTLMMQNHCLSIRQQIGYPPFAPANHSMAFAAGRPFDFEVGRNLARHAASETKDFVYARYTSEHDAYPADHTLAIRQKLSVEVFSGITFWAADEHAPLVIIAKKEGFWFKLNSRMNLERRSGRPARNLAQGEQRAMDRIRRAATTMRQDLIETTQFVPNGGPGFPAERQRTNA